MKNAKKTKTKKPAGLLAPVDRKIMRRRLSRLGQEVNFLEGVVSDHEVNKDPFYLLEYMRAATYWIRHGQKKPEWTDKYGPILKAMLTLTDMLRALEKPAQEALAQMKLLREITGKELRVNNAAYVKVRRILDKDRAAQNEAARVSRKRSTCPHCGGSGKVVK